MNDLYIREPDEDKISYIFKCNNKCGDRYEGILVGNIDSGYTIDYPVAPLKRLCRKLEIHEIVAYRLLGILDNTAL